ncbi:sigma-70 family RNA polymerase sigma factor [Lyngbya sp. CCY1209]|nr:sigma-70 family RNA polymerase sigma factor [Lyngbya sp. CCY1209]
MKKLDRHNSKPQLTVEFWQQFQEHQNYLYRCCLKRMGNPIEAEDALGAALLKAQEKLQNQTEPIRNWKGWLVQLTWNHCTDLLRQRDRHAVAVEDVEAIAPSSEWASPEPTPEQICVGWELEEFLNRAIEELPPKLRETLILHLKKQRSPSEIAAELNLSAVNVRKRISQARAILRDRLEAYQSDGDSLAREFWKTAKLRAVRLEPETGAAGKPRKTATNGRVSASPTATGKRGVEIRA